MVLEGRAYSRLHSEWVGLDILAGVRPFPPTQQQPGPLCVRALRTRREVSTAEIFILFIIFLFKIINFLKASYLIWYVQYCIHNMA